MKITQKGVRRSSVGWVRYMYCTVLRTLLHYITLQPIYSRKQLFLRQFIEYQPIIFIYFILDYNFSDAFSVGCSWHLRTLYYVQYSSVQCCSGSYKEMSSILAYQKSPRMWAQLRGGSKNVVPTRSLLLSLSCCFLFRNKILFSGFTTSNSTNDFFHFFHFPFT